LRFLRITYERRDPGRNRDFFTGTYGTSSSHSAGDISMEYFNISAAVSRAGGGGGGE
jgi:hypothetical protein